MDEVIDKIKEIIIEKLELKNITKDDIDPEEALFGGGLGLNSVESLKLIFEIEKHFNIKIEDDELTAELFNSVKSLAMVVVAKLQKKGEKNETNG